MNARVQHLGKMIEHPDDLVSLASFSMVEGVILYSSFAFLKHYQSQGKNKLLNIVRGINFSVRDENLHSQGGAWAFKHLKSKSNLSEQQEKELLEKIKETANTIYEHECEIIKEVFAQGNIEGVTAHQLECFVQSRVNECLRQLGYTKMFEVKYDPISSWFYKGINDFQFNDFFSGVGNQYHRNWDESGFVWSTA